LKEFRQFVVAGTPEEATGLKRSIGPGALYIAGGTSFVPFVKAPVEVLIDISRLGYSGIVLGGGMVAVGATTRIVDLMAPEVRGAAPMLHKAVRRLATPLVRNAATVGGNLAYVFLPSDLGVALLAFGAQVEILGQGARTVLIDNLLANGWLGGDDLVSKVTLKALGQGEGTGFAKFGKGEVDIALVSAAAWLRAEGGRVADLRLAVGQSSAMPALLGDLAGAARGEKATSALVHDIAERASEAVTAREDHRASAAYRKHLIKVMAGRALSEAALEAGVRIAD
jgi:carbon-monoxide dehydrogenase medium subunit